MNKDMKHLKPKPPYHGIRSEDHPARNFRDAEAGEQSWNVYFVDEAGNSYCIHIGPSTRLKMLEMLKEEYVKTHDPAALSA